MTEQRFAEPHMESDSIAVVPDRSLARALLKTARPKQWVKNVLVVAAPLAAGRALEGSVAIDTLVAFAAFLLASSCTYFFNDALDYEADRKHPKKRFRPIAAGQVGLTTAWVVGGVLLTSGLALAFFAGGASFGLLLAGYIAMTLSYSFWLKRVAVIELLCVAAGFVLRMIGGGLATDISISDWFLTVACFSSLFVVAGKRYSEILEMGEGNVASRAVLKEYTAGFLRVTYSISLAVSLAAYCQWAFDSSEASAGDHIWYQLSAIPWATALLRYALLLERGEGGAPEDVVMADRVLQLMGLLWIGFFALGVYDG